MKAVLPEENKRDGRKAKLDQLEEKALLPGSPAAGFFQVIGLFSIVLGGLSLFGESGEIGLAVILCGGLR
ncbi:hypothetical protein [Parasphingorhabdus halotolerans]|uniref:Uncharacterized protein n=1 Tax=Parasphingorhabdus halotolerans TaxID=2725558 RepID=A0A6H2DHD2_9SPHN|nr:hypothetical protein [Parasphingorhabdus halotolerans]QJB68082.1 hypothetical protein HF685_01145 [Parasphingorhabdus halotolerans]